MYHVLGSLNSPGYCKVEDCVDDEHHVHVAHVEVVVQREGLCDVGPQEAFLSDLQACDHFHAKAQGRVGQQAARNLFIASSGYTVRERK